MQFQLFYQSNLKDKHIDEENENQQRLRFRRDEIINNRQGIKYEMGLINNMRGSFER